MTAGDLASLDLSYAPQFGSARDPVIIAGMVLENQLSGASDGIAPSDMEQLRETGRELKFLDVRTPGEYKSGALPGAENIPLDELRSRLGELDKNAEIVTCCKVGLRGYLAERILKQSGFARVRNLLGGISSSGAPEERPARGAVCAVSVEEAARAKAEGAAVLLDVREREEYYYERIEGTLNCPLSVIDTDCHTLPKSAPFYIFCQSGVRSRQAAERLRLRGMADLRVVEGGLSAWKGKGLPVIKSGGPLPIMRQVQIAAGVMVLLAVLSVKFFWVAGLIGAGLAFAGVTGWCGLAKLLALMPWNESKQCMAGGDVSSSAGRKKGGCG